ncbi:MAG: hypothetical protein Q7I98_04945 [Erysipelotrichaceae bacterium]|nr:hypothetical protein [Erysipelotrichaceae bacterium]
MKLIEFLCDLDKIFEQTHRIKVTRAHHFRVPLDRCDKSAPFHFNALNHTVFRFNHRLESFSEIFHRLVVETVGMKLGYTCQDRQPAVIMQVDFVGRAVFWIIGKCMVMPFPVMCKILLNYPPPEQSSEAGDSWEHQPNGWF